MTPTKFDVERHFPTFYIGVDINVYVWDRMLTCNVL